MYFVWYYLIFFHCVSITISYCSKNARNPYNLQGNIWKSFWNSQKNFWWNARRNPQIDSKRSSSRKTRTNFWKKYQKNSRRNLWSWSRRKRVLDISLKGIPRQIPGRITGRISRAVPGGISEGTSAIISGQSQQDLLSQMVDLEPGFWSFAWES